MLKAASFYVFFLLSIFAPAHAQETTTRPPPEPPSRLSALVHDFSTLLNRVTGDADNHQADTDAKNHRAGHRSPTLPRPRPAAEPASMPVASNKEWSEFVQPPAASKKKTPTPVQIND